MSLKAHQVAGAEWLAKRSRALLGDAPRVGKTRTLIAGLKRAGAQRPLVVCPANARTHWLREFEVMGWDTRTVGIKSFEEIVRGGEKLREHLLGHCDSLIIDECHRVRTPTAQRTKLLLGKDGYARRLPLVWLASGTPIWKHPGNLWTILASCFPKSVIDRGLRSYGMFMNKICVYWIDEWGGYRVTRVKEPELLREILDEIMLRRTLDDLGDDVPELFWSQMLVDADELPDLPDISWLRARLTAGETLDGIRDPELATFRRLVGEAKVVPLVEQIVDELRAEDGSKIVVFAHHHTVLGALHHGLGSFGAVRVDGGTPRNKRDYAVDSFRTNPKTRVFIGQTQACMENLTLSAANRVIIVEPDYTATVNLQAASRVVNPNGGSKHNSVQLVALAGTLDENIVRQNVREAEMVTELLAKRTEGFRHTPARTSMSELRSR